MAPHSSILVWKIQWAQEPGRLQSMGQTWLSNWAHALISSVDWLQSDLYFWLSPFLWALTCIPDSLYQSSTWVSNRHIKLIIIKCDWMFYYTYSSPQGSSVQSKVSLSTSCSEHNLDLSWLSFSYSSHTVHQEILKRLNLLCITKPTQFSLLPQPPSEF